MTAAIVMPVAMLMALMLDRIAGEPPQRWHPVAGLGRYLQWAGARLPALSPARAFVGGTLAWSLGAALVVATAWVLQAAAWRAFSAPASVAGSLATAAALGLLLKPMFAWRMLREEVGAVEAALSTGLEAGRARVARLASRDVTMLDATQVRETAIETLAENLNDSVVAPLFWFAVAGLPGAALYRYANTADAMWGYHGRWEWTGKWAARADDALSWLPARLTALALLPHPVRWPELARQARRTPSPNGGWPMGAMALALGVRLAKPGAYLLNAHGRRAEGSDTDQALRHATRTVHRVASLPVLALVFASWSWHIA
jgi:adenosylcobinamide-phosphate synthase